MSTATPEEAVLIDALRSAGLEHVTIWHLRCLGAWAAQSRDLGRPHQNKIDRARLVEMRLTSDLVANHDHLHVEAQWEDARRTAERSNRRSAADLIREIDQTLLNLASARSDAVDVVARAGLHGRTCPVCDGSSPRHVDGCPGAREMGAGVFRRPNE